MPEILFASNAGLLTSHTHTSPRPYPLTVSWRNGKSHLCDSAALADQSYYLGPLKKRWEGEREGDGGAWACGAAKKMRPF